MGGSFCNEQKCKAEILSEPCTAIVRTFTVAMLSAATAELVPTNLLFVGVPRSGASVREPRRLNRRHGLPTVGFPAALAR